MNTQLYRYCVTFIPQNSETYYCGSNAIRRRVPKAAGTVADKSTDEPQSIHPEIQPVHRSRNLYKEIGTKKSTSLPARVKPQVKCLRTHTLVPCITLAESWKEVENNSS